MPERFETLKTYREHWFGIGRDAHTGRYVLDIPVSAEVVDYLEYYFIADEWALHPDEHFAELEQFARECRRQGHDDLLVIPAGENRGTTI